MFEFSLTNINYLSSHTRQSLGQKLVLTYKVLMLELKEELLIKFNGQRIDC
jgi:hypothetical protein